MGQQYLPLIWAHQPGRAGNVTVPTVPFETIAVFAQQPPKPLHHPTLFDNAQRTDQLRPADCVCA